MAKEKVDALVLDPAPDADGNPTRPATWHTVVGIPGFYFPGLPTCVGGDGEATFEQAQVAHDEYGTPLALVKIDASEAAARREAHAAHVKEARRIVVGLRRDGDLEGGDVTRINDELDALQGGN